MQAEYAYGATERERKVVVGEDATFYWLPSSGPGGASTHTLTIRWPAGTQTYTLTVLREDDTVDAVSADRKSLEVTWGTTGQPTQVSEATPAYIVAGGVSAVPVRVRRVVSGGAADGVLELSEPLPHALSLSGATALRWPLALAVLPAAHVGNDALRHVRWSVPHALGDTDIISVSYAHGLLHVVQAAFDTGLTDAAFLSLIPGVGRMIPPQQASWGLQRRLAGETLVGEVRRRLGAGYYEDDLAGPQFLLAHAYLMAALVLDGHVVLGADRAAAAAHYRELATAELDAAFLRLSWLDADRDGVVDAGETDVSRSLAGLGSSHVEDGSVFDDGDLPAPIPMVRVRAGEER